MEVPAIYAIAAGGIFLALFLIQTRHVLVDWTESFSVLLSGHLTLPVLVRRHRILGPWTRAGILVHVSYIAVNIALVFLRTESLVDSGRRAGELALINMIFPLSAAHLGFLAGLLGINWRTCRKIHRAIGWTAIALLSFHIIAELQGKTFRFPLTETQNLLTVIGASALGILALFSIPYFHRWSYEIFLRSHQILAGLFVYGTWQHFPTHTSSARLYVYVALTILGLTTLLELAIHLYRNGVFSGRGAPRALVSFSSKKMPGESHPRTTAANIQIILPRPLHVEPGQYINLWMPSVSWWSWTQTHPFIITSWSRGRQDTLKLLVQPRNGFSADLVRHGALPTDSSVSFLALFTGPHGLTEDVDPYETTLIIATGFGIATSIPYLKKMIHGYNTCTSHTRRLHLVWQVDSIEMVSTVEEQIDDVLEDDIMDKGYILIISIYVEHGLANSRTPVGKHESICYYQGLPDYRKIIATEASGSQIKRLPNIPDEPGRTLVMVSASDGLRDRLRDIARGYLHQGVELSELEYQPE
ncbi:hypothetical protein N7471_013435 [Penicillium samsonianum]|uniref:uncharacterized protein n=1 Tax=Penicillium samsonianum TaxID=1882272 RepID=UPI0025465CA6|nr:uncharacterized protein N7471_013435 [Penicillium samsonianum]KAJ6118815.1 hypothetical protein N7471_013435 [Penicillium samsonianum]